MNRFTYKNLKNGDIHTLSTKEKTLKRLYEYEELGYSPEQLEQIIRLYHIYKLEAHSTYGLCSGQKVGPDRLEVNIPKLIDEAIEKRDRSVSLYIGENGTSIYFSPWSEEDDNG